MELKYKTLKSGAKRLDVTGLTANQILSISPQQLNTLSKTDMRALTSRLVSAGNKRIRRIQSAQTKKGKYIDSPAVRRVQESGGMFSVKGKNLNELRTEFARIRGFYSNKTSSVAGAREYTSKFNELTKGLETDEEIKDFFDTMNMLRQNDPVTFIEKSQQIREGVKEQIIAGNNPDEVYNKMKNKMNDWYKLSEGQADEISQLFD